MIVLPLLLAAQARLTVPAGTYRLSELAATLNAQGVALRVDERCADDTFVANLPGVIWPDLRAALGATGRLTVTPVGDGWTLARDPEAAKRERAALANYLRAAGRRIVEVNAPLAQAVLDLQALPQAELWTRIEALLAQKSNDPAATRDAEIIRDHFQEGIPSTPSLVLPPLLAELPGGLPFGRLSRTSLVDLRAALDPNGNGLLSPFRRILNAGPGQIEALTREGVLASKLSVDPISLAASFRFTVRLTSGDNVGEIFEAPTPLLPPSPPRPLPPTSVWSRDERNAQNARAAATNALALPNARFALPPGPLRVSEALLRGARASGTNLLVPIGAFTDDVLNPGGPQTPASLLAAAEGPGLDDGWYAARLGERVPNAPSMAFSLANVAPKGYAAALRPPRFRSVTLAGGVLVVRDERAFLDGLCPTPTALPSSLENALLEGKPPTLTALAEAVAALKPSRWDTSLFATGYLRFCNPATFLPFARALAASPTLRESIARPSDRPFVAALNRLDVKARNTLIVGLDEATVHNDTDATVRPLGRPELAGDPFRAAPADYRLRVRRASDRLVFELLAPDGLAVWTSWASGVAPDL